MTGRLLKVKEAAVRLGVTPLTVYRMVECRPPEIDHHRVRGRSIRISEATIEKYLQRRMLKAAAA